MNEEKQKRIFLSPPHMGGEELRFVKAAFESNYIASLGPMVDAFQKEFSEKVGIKPAVAVSSGTAASESMTPRDPTGQCLQTQSSFRRRS